MEIQRKSLNALLEKENIYQLKVGQMLVEVAYSENNKSFYECMLNIFNKKNKTG